MFFHRGEIEHTPKRHRTYPLQKGKCEQLVLLKNMNANAVLMQENILIDNIFFMSENIQAGRIYSVKTLSFEK